MPSHPLTYAAARPKRNRFFHIFFLPLIWLPAGIGSRIYYGDEFGSFLAVIIPALPLVFALQSHIEIVLTLAIPFTLFLLAAVGHLMDRVPVPRWIWFAFIPLLLLAIGSRFFILQTIPPRPAPPPPGFEWRPEALFPAWTLSLYFFAVATIVLTVLIRPFFGRRAAVSIL
jgi:hypothetical protein